MFDIEIEGFAMLIILAHSPMSNTFKLGKKFSELGMGSTFF